MLKRKFPFFRFGHTVDVLIFPKHMLKIQFKSVLCYSNTFVSALKCELDVQLATLISQKKFQCSPSNRNGKANFPLLNYQTDPRVVIHLQISLLSSFYASRTDRPCRSFLYFGCHLLGRPHFSFRHPYTSYAIKSTLYCVLATPGLLQNFTKK